MTKWTSSAAHSRGCYGCTTMVRSAYLHGGTDLFSNSWDSGIGSSMGHRCRHGSRYRKHPLECSKGTLSPRIAIQESSTMSGSVSRLQHHAAWKSRYLAPNPQISKAWPAEGSVYGTGGGGLGVVEGATQFSPPKMAFGGEVLEIALYRANEGISAVLKPKASRSTFLGQHPPSGPRVIASDDGIGRKLTATTAVGDSLQAKGQRP